LFFISGILALMLQALYYLSFKFLMLKVFESPS
jgi:hypothetical protein